MAIMFLLQRLLEFFWLGLLEAGLSHSSSSRHICVVYGHVSLGDRALLDLVNSTVLSYSGRFSQAGHDVGVLPLPVTDRPFSCGFSPEELESCQALVTSFLDCSAASTVHCLAESAPMPIIPVLTSRSSCHGKDLCSHVNPNSVTMSRACDIIDFLRDVVSGGPWSSVILFYDRYSTDLLRWAIPILSHYHVGVIPILVTQVEPMEGGDLMAGVQDKGQEVNLTGVRFQNDVTYPSSELHLHVVLCVSAARVKKTLEQVFRPTNALSTQHNWLIIDPSTFRGDELFLDDVPISSPDMDVLLLRPSRDYDAALCLADQLFNAINRNSPALMSSACNQSLMLYRLILRPERSFQPMVTWLPRSGWTTPVPNGFFNQPFKDFGNRLLILGTVVAKPFVIKRTRDNVTVYDGYCIEILNTLAQQLNFRYTLVESPDKKYGAQNGDGTWNGMVGMVKRGEVEMGIGPYTINHMRKTVVDFSTPFVEDGGGILTTVDNSVSIMTGLGTFSLTVWLSLGATIVGVSLVLYAIIRWNPRPILEPDDTSFWRLSTCLFFIGGSLMYHSLDRHPRPGSARCVLGFWWVFSILVGSTYTANLVSILTVDVEGPKIESIEDLAKSSIKPLTLRGSIWDTLFQTAKDGVFRKIGERMRDMPDVTSDEEALNHMISHNMAYIMDLNNLRYMYALDCKRLHLAAQTFNSNGLGFILPENAPHKHAINDIILRLQEGGFLEMWRSKWWPAKTSCQAPSIGEAKQLGLPKLAGLLVVYMGMLGGSSLLFALTCAWVRLRHSRAKKKREGSAGNDIETTSGCTELRD